MKARKESRSSNAALLLSASAFFFLSTTFIYADPGIIGSKKFSESYVLAEIAKQSLERGGIKAEHRQGMGGIRILWEALRGGGIDVKDAYSTDAKIGDYGLVTLIDDLHFFPQYKAVFLYRKTLAPQVSHALKDLSNSIVEARMIRLNSEAERTKNYAAAGQQFFGATDNVSPFVSETFRSKLLRWVTRHLQLAGISLILAIIVGLPLGIIASRGGAIGHAILGATGVIQTIPSLALLALLVPLPFFGISARTAIVALFLYGLLPIVRNTATGLQDIPRPLRESAIALGLTAGQRLRKIFLPLASASILGGIKTSAVINIGTATLAALIGAGGLGEPIISGLNLNDHVTILEGAIPAALLALRVPFLL